jgi:hypothetical protein
MSAKLVDKPSWTLVDFSWWNDGAEPAIPAKIRLMEPERRATGSNPKMPRAYPPRRALLVYRL